jgi:hypothetical protein
MTCWIYRHSVSCPTLSHALLTDSLEINCKRRSSTPGASSTKEEHDRRTPFVIYLSRVVFRPLVYCNSFPFPSLGANAYYLSPFYYFMIISNESQDRAFWNDITIHPGIGPPCSCKLLGEFWDQRRYPFQLEHQEVNVIWINEWRKGSGSFWACERMWEERRGWQRQWPSTSWRNRARIIKNEHRDHSCLSMMTALPVSDFIILDFCSMSPQDAHPGRHTLHCSNWQPQSSSFNSDIQKLYHVVFGNGFHDVSILDNIQVNVLYFYKPFSFLLIQTQFCCVLQKMKKKTYCNFHRRAHWSRTPSLDGPVGVNLTCPIL